MKGTKTSKEWNEEYQRPVLKVPDSLAVEKGAVTEAMLNTDRELFKVKIQFGVVLIVNVFCIMYNEISK